ncbi:MAG TPA: DUF1344 domain-containing protein [Methylomirabilota bacterium]|jgi:hypothetical protein
MRHYGMQFVVAAGLVLMTGTVWADGPSAAYSGELEGTVRDVNRAQQVIILDDGTELSVASPAQLDNVEPGRDVHVGFVEDYGRKTIEWIDVIGQ